MYIAERISNLDDLKKKTSKAKSIAERVSNAKTMDDVQDVTPKLLNLLDEIENFEFEIKHTTIHQWSLEMGFR